MLDHVAIESQEMIAHLERTNAALSENIKRLKETNGQQLREMQRLKERLMQEEVSYSIVVGSLMAIIFFIV